jgi:hypothetical protein
LLINFMIAHGPLHVMIAGGTHQDVATYQAINQDPGQTALVNALGCTTKQEIEKKVEKAATPTSSSSSSSFLRPAPELSAPPPSKSQSRVPALQSKDRNGNMTTEESRGERTKKKGSILLSSQTPTREPVVHL